MIDVVAGLIIQDNKVLIARRASHKKLAGKWEFPGGKVKDGENHHQALERELFEEFGIRTKTGKHFLTHEHEYDTFSIRLIAYFTVYLEGDYKLTDHDSIKWVYLKELVEHDLAEADIPIAKELIEYY